MSSTTIKPLVHHLIILDESGSMSSIRNQTIQSFNELMSHNAHLMSEHPDQEHRMSFFSFNGRGIRTICFDAPLSETIQLSEENYNPADNTPLWDAMGSSILKVKHHIYAHPDHSVLVTVMTDGMENFSKEFTGKEISQMVDQLKEKNWVFVYMGTDHDVHAMANAMGEKYGNRVHWDKNNVHDSVDMIRHMRMSFASRVHDKLSLREDLVKEAKERQESEKEGKS